jgi:pimeloyl-ACP methyl ester carboxylesterase
MYATTLPNGAPAAAIATVLAPEKPPKDPSPVVAWLHGTVGIKQKCMPSTMTTPFESVPALEAVIEKGWVVVATDYAVNAEGVIPFLIGEGEARSALDSVRAARRMPELKLDSSTAVWGHSQGGQAALWTGISRRNYAPEVALAGVAAGAPATNLEQLNQMLSKEPAAASVGSYLVTAYSQYYPDVKFDDVIPRGARGITQEIADMCPAPDDLPRLQELQAQLGGASALAVTPGQPLAARLRENATNRPIDVPLAVVQGLSDSVVPPAVTDAFVDQQCDGDQSVAYWRVRDRDHNSVLAGDGLIPELLLSWTEDRFAGKPQTGCQTMTLPG